VWKAGYSDLLLEGRSLTDETFAMGMIVLTLDSGRADAKYSLREFPPMVFNV